MGQENSTNNVPNIEQGVEKIFANNYQILREQVEILGSERFKLNPYKKSKLIRLQKVICEKNQMSQQNGNLQTSLNDLNEQSMCSEGDYVNEQFEAKGNFEYQMSPSSFDLDIYQKPPTTIKQNPEMTAAINSEKKYSVLETYVDGSQYEGEKVGQYRQGYGIFVFQNQACYKGCWLEDKMDGRGMLYYPSGQLAYQGKFIDNKFDGFGSLNNELIDYSLREDDDKYFEDLNAIGNKWIKFEGEFYNDQKNGKGILYFSNGDFIQAKFTEDKINGECILFRSNNVSIKGYWKDNQLCQLLS